MILVLLPVLLLGLAPPLLAETDGSRFEVVAGALAHADGTSTPTTVLIDRRTGQSWMLRQGETAEWVAVPYGTARPSRLLPRLEGEPLLRR
jgi:hypothetical protein